MQLDYFISGSLIEQSFVKDKWLETTAFNTRSFPASKRFNFTGISGSQDFSLFFTLNKANSNAGNLFSNHVSGYDKGFSIAYNANNELFIKSFGEPVFAEKVDSLRLGQKNCLGIVKNDRNLTFYKYNLQGTGISQQQTVNFPKNINLDGGQYFLGSGSGLFPLIGLPGFSGHFDQMVVFNTALTKDQSLSIFSGFQPYTKTENTYYIKTYEGSGLERRPTSLISESDIKSFSVTLNTISNSIPTSTGNYVSIFSGTSNGGGFNLWSGSYAAGNSLTCYSTGAVTSSLFGTGTINPVSIGAFSFNDSILASMNVSGERLVSHFVTVNFGTGQPEDYFIYNLYQKYSSGVSGVLSLTGNYKDEFFMNGVITNNQSGLVLLSNVSGDKFNQIGYEGIFDRTIGLFAVNGLTGSGSRVYWGQSGKVSGYLLSSGYIDLINTVENETYPLYYDLGSGNTNLIHTTLMNYATGKFDPDTSIVFTGVSSFSDLFRVSKQDFWETSTYHLAHGDHMLKPTGTPIYLNSQDFWT